MTDSLERDLRAANPLRSRRTDPLSARAEADLASILSGDAAPAAAVTPLRPKRRAARFAWALAAVAALTAATVITVTTLSVNTPPSVAAPPALDATPIDEPLDAVIDRLASLAEEHIPAGSSLEQVLDYEAWYSDVTITPTETTHYVQPVEIRQVRHADLSGTFTTTAGRIRWGTPPPDGSAHEPGSIISEDTFAAGEFPTIYPTPPPTDAAEMRDYFAVANWDPDATSGEWFAAIESLAYDWKLDGPQTAAVLEFISTLPGVEVAGYVTDRLGRDGIAITTTTRLDGAFTDTLIFDSSTGRLLSSEQVYRGGLKQLDIPYPTVFSYVAWKETP